MNDVRLLHLEIAQTGKALSKAQNNVYSNPELTKYQSFLTEIFSRIQVEVQQQPNLSTSEIKKYKGFLEFIFKNLEYLEGSTLNFSPFELVFCLNLALKDWLDDQNYVIVTNLSNNIKAFHFDPWLLQNGAQILEDIVLNYDEKPNVSLVQVTLPGMLVRDYLTSIVLYHELGHFVDEKYKFTLKLSRILGDALYFEDTDAIKKSDFIPYFPEGSLDKEINYERIKDYLSEYFCDLFAAQYLGKGYMEYLFYVTEGSSRHSSRHPSSQLRKKVYNDFMEDEDNPIIHFFQTYLPQEINGKILMRRHDTIHSTDFGDLLPLEITNEATLHGVFSYGWDTWLGGWKDSSYLKTSPPEKVYSIINNLMEKSIGNYIVNTLWKNHQS